MDSKLNFAEHINNLVVNSIGKLITLYPISNRKSLVTSYNKLLLYKVVVRTAMTYACPVWSITCKSNYDKLQRVQNKFLRLVGNYRNYTLITKMHREKNLDVIKNFIHKQTVTYFNKI